MLSKITCTARAIKYSDAAGHRESFPLVSILRHFSASWCTVPWLQHQSCRLTRFNSFPPSLSVNVMSQLMDMMELPPRARKVLLTENMMFSSLIGAAVFSYGNDAKTFVQQSKICGVMTT